MSSIELSPSQRSILSALVTLHRERDAAVKGETIAQEVDRNPGTIRNQMQSLKALQLVEGVPGPKGGYKPTPAAFEALDIQDMDEPARVPVRRAGSTIEDVNVSRINLTSVHHPELCRAEVHVRGSVRDFAEGEPLAIGPTPLSQLLIRGSVDEVVPTDNLLILEIDEMVAPAADDDL